MPRLFEVNRNNFASTKISLHDARILQVSLDYPRHTLSFSLDTSDVTGLEAKSGELVFRGMNQMDTSLVEPWGGPSFYITTVSIHAPGLVDVFGKYQGIWQKDAKKPNLEASIQTNILLSSGDEINVVSESLTLELA
jgi:hypothetical protein